MPKPRVNLARFHGVFAPNSNYRVTITPAKRGKRASKVGTVHLEPEERTPMEQRAVMVDFAPAKPTYMPSMAITCARRLKRVFGIDITECEKCKGLVKIMPTALAALAGQAFACIEDPVVIGKILNHLKAKEAKQAPPSTQLPPLRAPLCFPGVSWDWLTEPAYCKQVIRQHGRCDQQ